MGRSKRMRWAREMCGSKRSEGGAKEVREKREVRMEQGVYNK